MRVWRNIGIYHSAGFLKNMLKIQCSVGILTFNSGETLRRALESIKDFDDIVVCDGGSTDATLDIAKKYGARIIVQSPACKNPDGSLKDFACAKNQLIDEAHHPYLLILDSDEAASSELVQEVAHITREGTEDGYRIPIRMWWRGKIIEHAANYPGYQYRILRTDRGVRMVKPVHEKPVFARMPGVASVLATPWYVFLNDDFVYRYMERNGKYVERELQALEKISLRQFLFRLLPENVRRMMGIILKTLWYRLRYPHGVHMPLLVELGRMRYHAALLAGALKQVCRI